MKFTSLNQMYEKYIQSFPELTHLDLTANQIKLIELVLSYTRTGNSFYMNYIDIADHLVIGKTDNRTKIVGNIVSQLKNKGYITTDNTPNFNGKNGGSSTTITVNEVYLEQMLLAAFSVQSPVVEINQIESNESIEKPQMIVTKPFIEELEESESEESRPIPRLTYSWNDDDSDDDDLGDGDFGYMEIETVEEFNLLLKRLLRESHMENKKSPLLYLLDNKQEYDLNKLKQAFEALILKTIQ